MDTNLSRPLYSQPLAPNRQLEAGEVQAELERRIRNGASYQTLWNTGYEYYRLHQRNQDTAQAIFNAFMSVKGQNEEQEEAIIEAAIYWQKIHDYGITNVPVGIDNSLRETILAKRRGRRGTLKMLRPKSGPVPMRESEASMGNRGKPREKANGTTDNPYPGPYYPGVYPP
ncbi:MAG: hypothetical protein LBE38_11140 [Deltaproteobacteria bacterium]|nr:hypothetical protein [Deltaproteobacteria bacterium]